MKYNWLVLHQNLEKHANKRLQQKCPVFRDPEIYDIFLWLKYFWSYKQIFFTPSLLITLYMILDILHTSFVKSHPTYTLYSLLIQHIKQMDFKCKIETSASKSWKYFKLNYLPAALSKRIRSHGNTRTILCFSIN